MTQTAVEWLMDKLPKSIETQFSKQIEQAKEMEKEQQGYNKEDLECAWSSSEQNMRFTFSSSQYKSVPFKKWFEQFKKK